MYSERYNYNILNVILMDPIAKCNLKCSSCWAAEYDRSSFLSFDDMEDGDFAIQLEIKEINSIQRRFERVFNRISFCVVLLAVSIIITGIIIGSSLSAGTGSEMHLRNVTVLEASLAIAVIIIFGLIISMFKSNRWVSDIFENSFAAIIVNILLAIILVTALEYITGIHGNIAG